MQFDSTKFKAILFTKTPKRYIPPFNIRYDNINIELTNEVNMLGILIDNKLLWNNHINRQCQRAKRILFQLNSCLAKTYGLPSFCIKQIYTSIIEPILLYGCFVWCKGIAKVSIQNKLKGIQRLAGIAYYVVSEPYRMKQVLP